MLNLKHMKKAGMVALTVAIYVAPIVREEFTVTPAPSHSQGYVIPDDYQLPTLPAAPCLGIDTDSPVFVPYEGDLNPRDLPISWNSTNELSRD